MSNDLLRLVSDTLSLFKEETNWVASAPIPAPKKPEIVKAAPTPPQQPKEPLPLPKKRTPLYHFQNSKAFAPPPTHPEDSGDATSSAS